MSGGLVREADDLCRRLDAEYRYVTGPVIPGQPVPDHRNAPRLARLRARAWDRYVRRWMVAVYGQDDDDDGVGVDIPWLD